MAREFRVLCCRRLGPTCAHAAGQAWVPGAVGKGGDWFGHDSAGFDAYDEVPMSFAARPEFTHYREVLAGLRKQCPAAKPVVVRTAWLPPTTLGECGRRRERFVIRLNRDQSQAQAVETLCHEWAHALAWSYSLDKLARDPRVTKEQFEAAGHDEAWGCAYSRVWRVYAGMLGG